MNCPNCEKMRAVVEATQRWKEARDKYEADGSRFGAVQRALDDLRALLPPAQAKGEKRLWCGHCAKEKSPDQVRSAPHLYECLACGKMTTPLPAPEEI